MGGGSNGRDRGDGAARRTAAPRLEHRNDPPETEQRQGKRALNNSVIIAAIGAAAVVLLLVALGCWVCRRQRQRRRRGDQQSNGEAAEEIGVKEKRMEIATCRRGTNSVTVPSAPPSRASAVPPDTTSTIPSLTYSGYLVPTSINMPPPRIPPRSQPMRVKDATGSLKSDAISRTESRFAANHYENINEKDSYYWFNCDAQSSEVVRSAKMMVSNCERERVQI